MIARRPERALDARCDGPGGIRMNIGYLILTIFGGAVGLISTLYIVVSLFATIGYKIYRKAKYGISLFK